MGETKLKLFNDCHELEKLFFRIFFDERMSELNVETSFLNVDKILKDLQKCTTSYFFEKLENNEILLPESYESIILFIKNSQEDYADYSIRFLDVLLKMLDLDIENRLPNRECFIDSIMETYMGIIKFLVEYNNLYDFEIKDYAFKLKEYISLKDNVNYIIWFNNLIRDIKLPLEKNKLYKPIEVFDKEEHEELCEIFMIEDCKDRYNFTGCSKDPEYIKILEDSNTLDITDYEVQADLTIRLGELSNKYQRVKGGHYRPLYSIAWEIVEELDVRVKTSPKLRYFLTKLSDLYSLNDTHSDDIYPPIVIVNYVIFYLEDYFKTEKLEKLLYELKCISYGYYNDEEDNNDNDDEDDEDEEE